MRGRVDATEIILNIKKSLHKVMRLRPEDKRLSIEKLRKIVNKRYYHKRLKLTNVEIGWFLKDMRIPKGRDNRGVFVQLDNYQIKLQGEFLK